MSQKIKKKSQFQKFQKKDFKSNNEKLFYEKRMLHKLISVNNSVAEFENKISIKNFISVCCLNMSRRYFSEAFLFKTKKKIFN